MESYVGHFQDLLHGNEDSEIEQSQLLPPPYSRPFNQNRAASNYFRPTEPCIPSSFRSVQGYQSAQRTLHLNPENLGSSLYNERNEDGLDDYDRALLAECCPQLPWISSRPTGSINSGRVSLPGHTTPHTPVIHSGSGPPQRKASTSQDFKSKLSAFIHTPNIHAKTNSSPVAPTSSSPLFNASQRRPFQTNRPIQLNTPQKSQPKTLQQNATPNTKKTRTHGVPQNDRDNAIIDNKTPRSNSSDRRPPTQTQIDLDHAPPVVQGIRLVSTIQLPDRIRSVFAFDPFNAVQSKCFPTVYYSDDNLVVSAPTGCGKTAIFELAICHLLSGFKNDQYKIVYMAPTKSLCSERQRDWQTKFATLDLVCAELTGDTDFAHVRSVQSANVIITTPEKFDSMTRQWKDHAKLIQLVKLFLIDEVHMLTDNRGATLEAVVSRMKSVGTSVRFIALSATVPNFKDVASWLGRNHSQQDQPAVTEVFGDEFRPVKLQKHVIGLPYRGNDFGFERICDAKLPSVIAKYGKMKPLIIFCITRSSAQSTAKLLSNLWASKDRKDRHWHGPTQRISVGDPELASTLSSAVAFHHAGLHSDDRQAIEAGFLSGQISVICCTSTLAVGINLPCHLVIIKNTMCYQSDALKEYAELEVTQMLGRAGRPQFDDSGVAVIITKQEKVKKYEQLVSGGEILESCLHLNLIDHLNAEIGLGTVNSVGTAKTWLAGTFLYVRLQKNPEHYKLEGDTPHENLDQRIDHICQRDLELLGNADLIRSAPSIKSTELGLIMARYYVQFKTMETILALGPRSTMSDILAALVQAQEYHEIRLKAPEKKLFKEINNSNGIKFPIKIDLAMHAHKRSLLVQSELGGVEYPLDEQFAKHKRNFLSERNLMFSNIHRLIRCVIDVQVYVQDAIGARHALELARGLSAGVWDNSPFQMKQIPNIGPVAIRKLALAGITSLGELEASEPHRIEQILSRNPPFGNKLISQLKDFPKLRVSVKNMSKEPKKGPTVSIKLKLECGFINEKAPTYFNRRPIYICLLTERSDGRLMDFRRISARKLDNGQDVLITAELLSHVQHITCYVMCEDIAGTMQYAELRPVLPAHLFTAPPVESSIQVQTRPMTAISVRTADDEFGAGEIDDQDMVDAVENREFTYIDMVLPTDQGGSTQQHSDIKAGPNKPTRTTEKLDNGRWVCNHKCKDKAVCKHLCCREGLDKPPKPPKISFVPASTLVETSGNHKGQTIIHSKVDKSARIKPSPIDRARAIEKVDLVEDDLVRSSRPNKKNPRQVQTLDMLHQSVNKRAVIPTMALKEPALDFGSEDQLLPSFLMDQNKPNSTHPNSTDYGDSWSSEFPSPSQFFNKENTNPRSMFKAVQNANSAQDDTFDTTSLENFDLAQFDDNEWDVEAALVGLSDSITMQQEQKEEAANLPQTDTTISTLNKVPLRTSVVPIASTINLDRDGNTLSLVDSKRPAQPTEQILEANLYNQRGNEVKRIKLDSVTETNHSLRLPVSQQSQHLKRHLKQPLPPSLPKEPSNKHPTPQPGPVIKPGHPAWVYDFDPAFIAEFQDIVEFV